MCCSSNTSAFSSCDSFSFLLAAFTCTQEMDTSGKQPASIGTGLSMDTLSKLTMRQCCLLQWHKCLGHIGMEIIIKWSWQGLIPSNLAKTSNMPSCCTCLKAHTKQCPVGSFPLAKQHRARWSHISWSAGGSLWWSFVDHTWLTYQAMLSLLHDFCGPCNMFYLSVVLRLDIHQGNPWGKGAIWGFWLSPWQGFNTSSLWQQIILCQGFLHFCQGQLPKTDILKHWYTLAEWHSWTNYWCSDIPCSCYVVACYTTIAQHD